jgi:hypothetical protein
MLSLVRAMVAARRGPGCCVALPIYVTSASAAAAAASARASPQLLRHTRLLATRAERDAARAPAGADSGAVAALFDQLERGVAPMLAVNAGSLAVAREGATALRFVGSGGKPTFHLTLEAVSPAPTLRLQSTASTGLAKSEMWYDYALSRSGVWACVGDGHLLLDLLTRDMLHHFKGVPEW